MLHTHPHPCRFSGPRLTCNHGYRSKQAHWLNVGSGVNSHRCCVHSCSQSPSQFGNTVFHLLPARRQCYTHRHMSPVYYGSHEHSWPLLFHTHRYLHKIVHLPPAGNQLCSHSEHYRHPPDSRAYSLRSELHRDSAIYNACHLLPAHNPACSGSGNVQPIVAHSSAHILHY